MIFISKQSIFYVVKCKNMSYQSVCIDSVHNRGATFRCYFAATLKQRCTYMSWKTTFYRISMEDMNLHVYFGHFNPLV